MGAASINMNVSRKSSHSFGSRSIRTIGGGSRNNLFNSSSRKSVAIESSRAEKTQIKPPVQVYVVLGFPLTCWLQGFQGFLELVVFIMFICFLVAAITFKLSKGTLEFVATCLV